MQRCHEDHTEKNPDFLKKEEIDKNQSQDQGEGINHKEMTKSKTNGDMEKFLLNKAQILEGFRGQRKGN